MAAGQNTRYTKSVLQGKLLQIDYHFMNKKGVQGNSLINNKKGTFIDI